jgi:hypothetical protein
VSNYLVTVYRMSVEAAFGVSHGLNIHIQGVAAKCCRDLHDAAIDRRKEELALFDKPITDPALPAKH